jgi:hypothetical protein
MDWERETSRILFHLNVIGQGLASTATLGYVHCVYFCIQHITNLKIAST